MEDPVVFHPPRETVNNCRQPLTLLVYVWRLGGGG